MTQIKDVRKIYHDMVCLDGTIGGNLWDRGVATIGMVIYELEAKNWLRQNGKEDDDAVPFTPDSVLTLPLDDLGYVIPVIPQLEDGVWYDHDLSEKPLSPAAFADPETLLEVHTRTSGVAEQPVKLKNINWTGIRRYRKFEALDETIACFGMF